MAEKIYQPKGSMCASCKKALDDCSKLDFSAMKPIGWYKIESDIKVTIVRCAEFKRA